MGRENDPVSDQALLLEASNDARCEALEAETNSPGSLENVFDALKITVLLEHMATTMGVRPRAELAFEVRREEMIEKIEARYAEMKAAKEEAERLARLAGGPTGFRGGVPQRPGPGGIVKP